MVSWTHPEKAVSRLNSDALVTQLPSSSRYWPYVMIFDKQNTKPTDSVRRLQRWVNMRATFESVKKFEDYTG